jgi:nuclear transport factor 2 (NTF2) superfamily protein
VRDPERIDKILAELGIRWKKSPDMRLIQLIWAYTKAFREGRDGFYYEDDRILEDLIEANGGTNETP